MSQPQLQFPRDEKGNNVVTLTLFYIFHRLSWSHMKHFYLTFLHTIIFFFTGQYVTLSILKQLRNGNKITINTIVIGEITVNIPNDIIQIGPSSNTDNFTTKIYFKQMKYLSVHYNTEDGQPHTTTLQHLKKVRWIL